MKIVLEGLPGAGKSTLTKILEQKLLAYIVPELTFDDYKEDTPDNQSETSEDIYLRNDEEKCKDADEKNKKEKLVIMDRNYISTLAYNFALTKYGISDSYKRVVSWYEKELGHSLT